MKEIGLKLKLKREENGVSLEEAADDLKMRVSQLSSIEEGKKDDFRDVFSLKYFIRDYAKYLGLNGEDMLDDFNEYLFQETSKISLSDIEKAKKEKEEKEKNMKILSPYTVTDSDRKKIYVILMILILIIIISICCYIGIRNSNNKDDFIDSRVSYRMGDFYEFG